MTVWPLEPTRDQTALSGTWTAAKPKPPREERQPAAQRSAALGDTAWREITVAEGSQGPRPVVIAPNGCGCLTGASPAKSFG